MIYPNLLIVGAAKSGTTSLHNYLSTHPEIFMSEIKEPYFLAIADLDKDVLESTYVNYITSWKSYSSLFEKAKNFKIRGESSVIYLYYFEHTIQNIKKYIPNWRNMKIVAILRSPAERIISHYYHLYHLQIEKRSLKEVLITECSQKRDKEEIRKQPLPIKDYFGMSLYSDAVKAYKKNFHTKIFLYEEFKENPLNVVQEIFEFLDVDKEFTPPNLNVKYNVRHKEAKHKILAEVYMKLKEWKISWILPSSIRKSDFYVTNVYKPIKNLIFTKKIPVSKEEILRLNKDCFEEDILKLEKIINKDLSHWLP